MSERKRPEQLQGEDWAGEMGERWLASIDRFEAMIAPVGAALIAHAGFRPGERVVDIGCGGGVTTTEIARAVGPGGEALGIDISPGLIAEAERRARAAAVPNVRFMVADAATVRPQGSPFDRLASRFGSMFFADPPSAFANLRAMLRQGGRADLAVWAPPSENQWIGGMMAILGRHVELPAPVPHAPGPFALDDPDYVRPLLAQAGFGTIEFTLWRGDQLIGGAGADPDSAASFVLDALSFARALDEKGPEVRDRAQRELAGLFAQHHSKEGVRMGAAAWLVTAYAGER